MTIDPSIMKRARDLRALAERAGSVHESQAAARQLARLLQRHRIDPDVVAEEQASSVTLEPEPLYTAGRIASWRKFLLMVLAEHFGVAAYILSGWRHATTKRKAGRCREQRICGRPADCERVRFMYSWLAADAVRLCASRPGGRRRRASSSWCHGFVEGISKQLIEPSVEAENSALVIRRSAESQAFLAAKFKIVTNRPRVHVDHDDYVDGTRAGANHHLGAQLCPTTAAPRLLTQSGSEPSPPPSPD